MNNFGLVVIGAHDGSGLENEVLKTSKKILFVEPVKYNFSELQDRYKNLNNIYFDNSAVSNNNDKLNFFYVKKNSVEKLGKHWATGIGSFSKKHILDHKSKRFQISDNDIDVNEITPLTFDQLMTKYDINIIDKLLIDIEGSEKKIIESIDFKKTLILELTFEYKHLDDTFVFNNSLKIMTKYLSDRNFKEINRDKENITFKNSQWVFVISSKYKGYLVNSKASTQEPFVEALEYSVALPSKKFICSTPFNISSNQVNGFSLTS